jgi:hypothetical protein
MIELRRACSPGVEQEEAIPVSLSEDEGLAGGHALAGVAALGRAAGSVCYGGEVRCNARAIVGDVDSEVVVAAVVEVWAKDVSATAGVVEGWAGEDGGSGCCGGFDVGCEDGGVCWDAGG